MAVMDRNRRMRQWGATIRALRRSRGLTQRDLGELLGVGAPTICRWELGRMAPRNHHKLVLAEVLDVDMDVLFPRDTRWTGDRPERRSGTAPAVAGYGIRPPALGPGDVRRPGEPGGH